MMQFDVTIGPETSENKKLWNAQIPKTPQFE